MKKTNKINSELSIEERKKKIIEFIEKPAPKKKREDILMPFISEIKLMLDKKMSIYSQLKALSAGGVKINYKTYKSFLDELQRTNPDAADIKPDPKKKDDKPRWIILNDKGAVKTYAVKNEIKKLGFTWDSEAKAWTKEMSPEELEKVKNLKVGYDIK
jgi:hypothetical protein